MQRAYTVLIKQVPLAKSLVEHGDAETLAALYRNVSELLPVFLQILSRSFWQLRKGSDNARGDDAGNLKSAIVAWVNDQYGLSTPVLRVDSKKERGLENDHTSRLLCPAEFDWDNER